MSNDPGDYVASKGKYVIYAEPRLDQDVYMLYKEEYSMITYETIRHEVGEYSNLDGAYVALEIARRKDYEKSRKRMNNQPMWDKVKEIQE